MAVEMLQQFIDSNRDDMLADLRAIVESLKADIAADPDLYRGIFEDCDPAIDVRLCVDLDPRAESGTWIFRTGDASYDQRHSDYCGAGSVGADTDPADLLETLIDQLFD